MTTFSIDPDGVDPALVPTHEFYNGAKIPAIGLGTFGSDRYSPDEVAAGVLGAVSVGYRHIDCAAVYGNEPEIGQSLQTIMNGGIKREDLWITSKLWNDKHAEEDVIPACKKTLTDLQLDYLDLYLVHWPFPNHHAPGVDVSARDPHAKPYNHGSYMKVWRQMEKLVEMGLVRNIGTSNMTIPKMDLLLADAKIKPVCNQMELHPHMQQEELFQYMCNHCVIPVGYCPIGSPSRPERDRTPDDTVDMEDPVIVAIAERLHVHPAVVCVKWALQRGQISIPFSVKRGQYLDSLRASISAPLTDADMRAIAQIDKNCRLVKAQVFLWPHARTWEDLWDVNGEIAQ